MTISHGNSTKIITLYPLAKSSFGLKNSPWIEDNDEETIQLVLTLDKAYTFRRNTKDDLIFTFIVYPHTIRHPNYPSLGHILRRCSQETCSLANLAQQFDSMIPLDAISKNHITQVEIHSRKTLNVNSKLEPS